MKKITTFFVLLMSFTLVYSQDGLNRVIFDQKANQDILYGYCNKDGLTGEVCNEWFLTEYSNYLPDMETLKKINPEIISDIRVTVVLGTWCSDSQREVPRFYRIAESLGIDQEKLSIIAVNRSKAAENTPIDEMDIQFVPTFIFYFSGEEIGRIVESPAETLEKDMLNFLSEL